MNIHILPHTGNGDVSAEIPLRATMLPRLRRGDICDLVVDTETSDLSKYFARPAALGAVLADPFTRRIIHVHERKVSFPAQMATFDVVAGLVTERSPETFKDGMRPDLAMAEFYDLIRGAPLHIANHYADLPTRIRAHNAETGDDLPLPPEGDDAVIHYRYLTNRRTRKEREERIKDPKETRAAANIVFIPMRDETGQVVYDAAISTDGKFAYWRENGLWQRTEAKKTVIVHNQRADNNWIWEWCHSYLLPDQFITHTKKYRAYLLDTIPLAREVALMGPQGRNGLKLGTRVDPALGLVSSTSLDTIMAANRRIANLRLHLNAGVRIAGGAQADPRMGHVSPAYDCLKTLGLYWYCQDIAPDMVAYKKELSDHDLIGDAITSPLPDGSPAPFAFIRARYPHLDTHAGLTLNLDKSYGAFKKAVVLALDVLREDPEDPHTLLLPDGRNLFDLTHDEWIDLLLKSHTDRTSPVEIISLNKSAMIQKLETALEAGALQGITPEVLNRRAQLIGHNVELRDRVMEAYARTRTRQDQASKVHDPRPEEYVFAGIGDPPMMQIDRKDMDERREMQRAIYERAKSKTDFYSKRNHYLRILLRPYPEIEGEGEDPKSYLTYERHFKKTLAKYERLMRGTRLTRRERNEIARINVPKYKRVKFEDNKQVRKFLWALRAKALKKNWLIDVSSSHYRVVDEATGREIPLNRLAEMDIRHFRDRMDPKKGSWDIHFERLNHQQHFLAQLFVLADRKGDLYEIDKDWKKWYKAQKAFGHNGSPLVDADAQRLPTAARNLSIIRRIRAGTVMTQSDLKIFADDPEHAASIRAKLIDGLPGREQILDSFERQAQEDLKDSRWTEETLEYAGYDHQSLRRFENISYPIARDVFDAATILEIPESVAENPLRSDVEGEMIYPVPITGAVRKLWTAGKLARQANCIFRTPRSGRTYLIPKARFTPTTLEYGSYHYQMVRQLFNDAGMPNIEPDKQQVMMVSAEGCFPLPGVRVVEPHFTVPVIGQHRFRALLTPDMAGFQDRKGDYEKRLSGLAIPDYGYEPKRGYDLKEGDKIRLRETDGQMHETGWEIGVTLKSAKSMTLAEFEKRYADGRVDPAFARDHGFASPEQMYTEICQWFTGYDKPKGAADNTILLVRFKKAKTGKGTDYFNPALTPRTAILETYNASLALMKNRIG